MKKKLGLMILSLMLLSNAAVYAEGGAVAAKTSQGTVTVVRGGETMSLEAAGTLQNGDIVTTGSESSTDVAMNGLAGFRLLASSEASIENTAADAMRLKINKGNIILNLQKLPVGTSFEMETPTAVAAVRGTQFWGRVESSATNPSVTTLAVREGAVEVTVKASGEMFKVNAGEALDIPLGVGPRSLRQALEAEMQAMAQASDIPTAL